MREEGKNSTVGPSLKAKLSDEECPQNHYKWMVLDTSLGDQISKVCFPPYKEKRNPKVLIMGTSFEIRFSLKMDKTNPCVYGSSSNPFGEVWI